MRKSRGILRLRRLVNRLENIFFANTFFLHFLGNTKVSDYCRLRGGRGGVETDEIR